MKQLLSILLLLFFFQLIISSDVWDAKKQQKLNKDLLKGLNWRAIAYNYPPLFAIKKRADGNFTYSGVVPEVFEVLAEYFKISLRYVHLNVTEAKRFGVSLTAMNLLLSNEADIASNLFERMESNLKRMDLLYPSWIADFVLMQPWPEEESRLSTPIRPFTATVWFCFITSIVAFVWVITAVTASQHAEEHERMGQRVKNWQVIYPQLEFVIRILTYQGSYYRFIEKLSVRTLVSFWLLAMVVLTNAYTGVLTAILAVPKLKPTVDTLEQLTTGRHRPHMTIEMKSQLTTQFMEATSGTYKLIGDSLRKHPEFLFADVFNAIDNVLNRHCVYPGTADMVNYFIGEDVRVNGKCRMTASLKRLSHYMTYHFGIHKNSPYTEILNLFFLFLYENGLTIKLRRKYLPSSEQCRTDTKLKGHMKTFKLVDFTSAFFCFGIGISLSLITFLLELLISFEMTKELTSQRKRRNPQKEAVNIKVVLVQVAPVYRSTKAEK